MFRPRDLFERSKARRGDSLRHQIPVLCPHSLPTGFTLIGAVEFLWNRGVWGESLLTLCRLSHLPPAPPLIPVVGALGRFLCGQWHFFVSFFMHSTKWYLNGQVQHLPSKHPKWDQNPPPPPKKKNTPQSEMRNIPVTLIWELFLKGKLSRA